MKARCGNPNNPSYPRYGGAGIKVCERWQNSFANFLEDMGERPDKTTIDRIDPKENYTPENCKWSSIAEQQRNRKNNIYLAFNGKNQCLKDWANELGVSQNTLSYRLKMQWPIEKILMPIQKTAA
jgi:transcriptional regulator with AAA-type ATPase domain